MNTNIYIFLQNRIKYIIQQNDLKIPLNKYHDTWKVSIQISFIKPVAHLL